MQIYENYLHTLPLAYNSQASIRLKAPNVARRKPVLAVYDVKLCSSLLGIVVIAESNVTSTQPDLTTGIWHIRCAIATCNNQSTDLTIIKITVLLLLVPLLTTFVSPTNLPEVLQITHGTNPS